MITSIELGSKSNSLKLYFIFTLGPNTVTTTISSGSKPQWPDKQVIQYNSESIIFYKMLEKKRFSKDKILDDKHIDLSILRATFKQEHLCIITNSKIQGKFRIILALFPYKISPHDMNPDISEEIKIYSNNASNEEIYHGKSISTGKNIIISYISFENQQAFLNYKRNVEKISKISNPDICKIININEKNTERSINILIITEKFVGCFLFEEIQQRKVEKNHWNERELLQKYYELICLFLEYSKEELYHGDINPLSIQVTPRTRICKIGMYSTSLELYLADISNDLPEWKIPYFSPNIYEIYQLLLQKQKIKPYNLIKSDIFSLGLVFYHMASLQAPLGLNDIHNNLESRIASCIASLLYSENLKNIISKMLIIQDEKRDSLIKIKQDIESYLVI